MTQRELPLGEHAPKGGGDSTWSVIAAFAVIGIALVLFAPILGHMVLHWLNSDGDYTHGLLIVPLSLYFAFERRDRLRQAPIEMSWWGIVPLALGAVALAIGRLGVELTSMRTGVILTLIGFVLLLFGRHVFKILAFPLFFLFLMVPLPQSLVNTIAFPLQLIAAQIGVSALHLLGVPALVEGNIIHLAHVDLFVAKACSGLRSLMALITLGVVFSYFLERGIIRRAIIVASTIPIAILVNAFRVALTALIAHYHGSEIATGPLHDYQGVFLFGMAFVLLLAESALLNLIPGWRRPGNPARKAS